MEPTKKTETKTHNVEKFKMQEQKIEKVEKELAKDIAKTEEKVEDKKITQTQANKEIEKEVKDELTNISQKSKDKNTEDKPLMSKDNKEIEKKSKHQGPKKTEAIVKGRNLSLSTKHAIAICNFIRNKDIDKAISMMEDVEKMKIPVPMKGEIPHRKGKIMSGRYPVKAAKQFVLLLKSLKANALMNELELEKYKIFCKANLASRPYRRFGRGRFKRTHVELKLIRRDKK